MHVIVKENSVVKDLGLATFEVVMSQNISVCSTIMCSEYCMRVLFRLLTDTI